MTVRVCDICQEVILGNEKCGRFKAYEKRGRRYRWYKLDAHAKCIEKIARATANPSEEKK